MLYLLISAFTIWMCVDAIRRRVDFYWILIIILFPPLGGIIYVFAVLLRDGHHAAVTPALPRSSGSPPLARLRQAVEESPSLSNRLALAEGLREAKKYQEASGEYQTVLRMGANEKEALHGLALCQLELDAPGEAVHHLSRLMDLDSRFRDYSAALDYAEALWLDGQKELCLEVLEHLTGTSSRINHRLAFANYLALAGDVTRARELLELALKDFEQSPSFVQRRDQAFAKDAEKLLAQLG